MRPAIGQTGLGALFFLISFGLGYPTLNRYDPRKTGGLSDTCTYYDIATHGAAEGDQNRYRVLVPKLAGAVARVASGHTGTWEPVFFGFLVVNSFFTSVTALLICGAGRRLAGTGSAGLLGAALYLLNFETANVVLSGMVDSADGCFVMAIGWCLLWGPRWLAPVWGLLGAAVKETFVPLASVFALVWWFVVRKSGDEERVPLAPALGICVAAFAGIIFVQSAVSGHLMLPWRFAAEVHPTGGYARALLDNTLDRNVLFMAIWLLPAGIPRLGAMPRGWVAASGSAAVTAVALAAWHGSSPGASARPLFSVAGPLLSLSAALWLTERDRILQRQSAS